MELEDRMLAVLVALAIALLCNGILAVRLRRLNAVVRKLRAIVLPSLEAQVRAAIPTVPYLRPGQSVTLPPGAKAPPPIPTEPYIFPDVELTKQGPRPRPTRRKRS